jgi:HK97 family phage portal protein
MIMKLPIIGQVKIGREKKTPEPVVQAVKTPPKSEPKKKLFDVLGGLLEFNRTGLSNEKTISTKILNANKEWVFRNNDVIAEEASKMVFQLFTVGLKKGEITYTEVEEHPLLDLLEKFNSTTTKADGLYITQSHKKLTGDAFWLLDKKGNTVNNIFVLPPDKIELKLGDPTDATANLVEGYIYRDTIDGKNIQITYDRDQIIHFKKPNPKNPFRGYGVVEAISETIDADNMANVTQSSFFEKGAITNFVLTTDSKLTQDQIKRMRAEMRASYSGPGNSWTTMIFGNGLKPSPLGFNNQQMQFIDLLEWYRDKIMVGFGNTKASIGIIDDVNRASHESAMVNWLRSTVKPDMDSIINTLNEFLVPLYGKNLVLGYENPVPEDRTDDLSEAVQLKNAGIIMVNEARELLGYESVDGGDMFAPLSSGTAAPGQEPPANPDTNNPNDPNKPDKPDNNQDNPDDEEQQPTDEEKRFRLYRRRQFTNKFGKVPPALAHLDIKQILRRRKMFTQQHFYYDLKKAAKPLIREMLKNGKKQKVVIKSQNTIHTQFTDDEINAYYEKQMHIVDVLERKFHDTIVKFIGNVENDVMNTLEHEVKSLKQAQKKELIDEDKYFVQAQLDFTPILGQQAVLSGQEAYALLDSKDVYIPYKIEEAIKRNVRKFTESMLSTERDKIVQIISDGVDLGSSVPEIRNNLQAAFDSLKQVQAERITRTEVLRVSTLATEDAYKQSGVVSGKQWLTAPDADEDCMQYAGKVVDLDEKFYRSDNEFEDGNPPIHPNCRCVLIPIVDNDAKRFSGAIQKRVRELEKKIDKRKKSYRHIKDLQNNLPVYLAALEKQLEKQEVIDKPL